VEIVPRAYAVQFHLAHSFLRSQHSLTHSLTHSVMKFSTLIEPNISFTRSQPPWITTIFLK